MAEKNLPFSLERRQALIEVDHPQLSIRRPCELIGLHRGTFYYQPAGETPLNLELMRLLDEEYTCHPFYGSPKMTTYLPRRGYAINHKLKRGRHPHQYGWTWSVLRQYLRRTALA